jgi:hypothetical protein
VSPNVILTPRTALIFGCRLLARLRVRELPMNSNGGPMVAPIQEATGQKEGAAWCASFLAFVARALTTMGVRWSLPYSAGTDEVLAAGRAQGMEIETPVVGCLFFRMASHTDARHVGLVVAVHGLKGSNGWTTIEGNAADPKGTASDNGYGVFEGRVRGTNKDLQHYVFIDPWKGEG